jgi:hypothetical protein
VRALAAGGARVGVFTDGPEELARVALDHLGIARRVDVLETGAGSLDRLLEQLGEVAVSVVRTPDELRRAAG